MKYQLFGPKKTRMPGVTILKTIFMVQSVKKLRREFLREILKPA
jgi:hypothetical protein